MSGPKDYRILLDVARIRAQELRRAEQTRRRNEALRKRAEENRVRLASEVARLEKQREALRDLGKSKGEQRAKDVAAIATRPESQNSSLVEARDKRLESMAEANRGKINTLKKSTPAESLTKLSSGDGNENTQIPNTEQIDRQIDSEKGARSAEYISSWENTSESDPVQDARVHEALLTALQWKEELGADPDVADFNSELAKAWEAEYASMLNSAAEHNNEVFLNQVDLLIEKAKSIHDNAGEVAMRFNARNELISDIISSLKEIGFVVNDPSFENDDDPSGAVVLVASKGSERIEAQIDLSDEIRSTWNNITGEHCKASFFEYVDAMGNKGLEIQPHREDLRTRPIHRRKGEKDLPRSKADNA